MGVITSIGQTVEEFWRNLTAGVSGVARITSFDPSMLDCQIASEVRGFDPSRYMEAKTARRTARFAQFAVAATKQAVDDAKLTIDDSNSEQVGLVINTGGGGLDEIFSGSITYLQKGPQRVSPLLVPSLISNMASCVVSIQWGIKGPVITSIAACASGNYAFVEAKRILDLGEAEVVIAGGSESAMIPLAFAALGNMHALSTRNDEPEKACRPFDLNRDGFVFGEGAAVMVLESYQHAMRRGANVYAELAGGSLTGDAYHITAPDPSGQGAALAMRRALKAAGMEAEEIDYIVAHGTGTPLNDASETASIKRAFGEHAYRLAISSPKSMIGHLLGAAGAISSVVAVKSICDGVIPPTINLDTPDPQCDLDYVPNVARQAPVRAAMVNGFGFGGQNSSVIFRQFTG